MYIMPFTPFHFGPGACIALPLHRYIDLPVFLLANVAIDLEPLTVILFQLNYPMHGFIHTFLFGTAVAAVLAIAAYGLKGVVEWLMKLVRLPYKAGFIRMLLSSILGAWLHILLDAPLYSDIRPFYPSAANPLYGIVSASTVYLICGLCFIPAAILYIFASKSSKRC